MNNCFVLLSIMGGIRVDTRDLCQRKFSRASDDNDAAAVIVEPSPGIRQHLSFAFHRKPGFHITRENERVCEFGSRIQCGETLAGAREIEPALLEDGECIVCVCTTSAFAN